MSENTRYVRYHSADDGMRLHELREVIEPVAVVLRKDGSVDVYGQVGVVDQRRPCTDEACGAEACPEHPVHLGGEHTYEMHHSHRDHVGTDQGGLPAPCRCIGNRHIRVPMLFGAPSATRAQILAAARS